MSYVSGRRAAGRLANLASRRNQIPVSRHHISGTYQPIVNECQRSNRFK